MGTLFQYARGRSRHSKLASFINLGLLLWFSAGTGSGIELLVCTKWKCLPDPSLFSGCPMSFVPGLGEGDDLVLAWMEPFLWKYRDSVLAGGPREPKEVSGGGSSSQQRGGTWIYGFLDTQDISWLKEVFSCTRKVLWTHHSHSKKKSVDVNLDKIKHEMRCSIFWMDTIF